ncbi:MAG: hypothetical protein ACPGOY_19035, partial [Rhodospirillaceae bacterium]
MAALSTEAKGKVASGDLLVLTAAGKAGGRKYVLASFHGDTDGLATLPVLEAVHAVVLATNPNPNPNPKQAQIDDKLDAAAARRGGSSLTLTLTLTRRVAATMPGADGKTRLLVFEESGEDGAEAAAAAAAASLSEYGEADGLPPMFGGLTPAPDGTL